MEQVSKNDYENCTLNFPDQEPNLVLVNKSPHNPPYIYLSAPFSYCTYIPSRNNILIS